MPMPGLVFLLAMFGSFLCCFNTPAAPAADEIAIKKDFHSVGYHRILQNAVVTSVKIATDKAVLKIYLKLR